MSLATYLAGVVDGPALHSHAKPEVSGAESDVDFLAIHIAHSLLDLTPCLLHGLLSKCEHVRHVSEEIRFSIERA